MEGADDLPGYRELKKLVILVYAFSDGCGRPKSQREIATRAGVSQQSISRLLLELEREGYLARRGRGELSLTEKGRRALSSLLAELGRVLSSRGRLVLRGEVISGLGEGRYYMGIGHYLDLMERMLGFRPYQGTLNVRILEPPVTRDYIASLGGLRIGGFSNGVRTYGGALLVPCEVRGYGRAAVIIPERTSLPDNVVEIVARDRLRDVLGLRDGDAVFIELDIPC
ncbi:MAG: DUF120 domain-containing protein [Desulfurococcaceae archaeon]